jgi:DNA-binding transcriptional MerR regulator
LKKVLDIPPASWATLGHEEKSMKTLYVKELSKITKTSIRTLHYYDKIGLLKPSERLSNGYRVYSNRDLQRLEKIIALKFLGFTLARIQQLLVDDEETLEFLENRMVVLDSEILFLQKAQKPLLLTLIDEYKNKKSVNWHEIANLILSYTKSRDEFANNTLFEKKKIESSQVEIWQKLIAQFSTINETEK